jgi:hypothetical protein
MPLHAGDVLAALDRCCESFTFPMLDNGYVYLGATRLALFRSDADWAMTIEVFGFSPRAGLPDTAIYTFASTLRGRKERSSFVSEEAHRAYLARNPHNEVRTVFPLDEGFEDIDDGELVAQEAVNIVLRGRPVALPDLAQYRDQGVLLADPSRVRVFELCRYLAGVARHDVLATGYERRANVPASLEQILLLDEWHHPDVVDPQSLPSRSETFQQLAVVLQTGDVARYRPSSAPNTHWRHWPECGQL